MIENVQPNNIYRMLTIDECVDILGISERQVRMLANEGILPSWRPSAATVRIPYWVLIWKVSRENGVNLDEMAPKSVTNVVTMLTAE